MNKTNKAALGALAVATVLVGCAVTETPSGEAPEVLLDDGIAERTLAPLYTESEATPTGTMTYVAPTNFGARTVSNNGWSMTMVDAQINGSYVISSAARRPKGVCKRETSGGATVRGCGMIVGTIYDLSATCSADSDCETVGSYTKYCAKPANQSQNRCIYATNATWRDLGPASAPNVGDSKTWSAPIPTGSSNPYWGTYVGLGTLTLANDPASGLPGCASWATYQNPAYCARVATATFGANML